MASQSSTASSLVYEALPAEVVYVDRRAYGSFSTTVPAAFWLRSYLSLPIPSKSQGKRRDAGWADEYHFEDTESSSSRSPSPLPIISRTSSVDSSLDEYAYVGASSSPHSPPKSLLGESSSTTLHPILKAVEKASKLSCHTVCVACLKTGRDFPRCSHCGDTWCSRSCRMQRGKRHVCRM
jgi:hypothetical protein